MDPLTRTLKNGKIVDSLSTPVKIEILTRCPKKWAFVDMETGQVWQHCFDQLRHSDELKAELRDVLFNQGVLECQKQSGNV